MTERDDLDAELRRLFDDDRLAVRTSEDAPARIVAGARRVRRRRATLTATGGVLTAVVLVGAGLALGQLRSTHTDTASPVLGTTVEDTSTAAPLTSIPLNPLPPSSSSGQPSASAGQPAPPPATGHAPAQSSTPTSTSTPSRRVPLVSGPVLGPSGYSKLFLGMSFSDAKNTGLLAGADTPPSGCASYSLTEGTAGVRDVTISDTNGIVSFEAGGAHTPERIHVGSTKDDLEAAYPALSKSGSGYTAAAGSGGSYVFSVDQTNRVSALLLVGSAGC